MINRFVFIIVLQFLFYSSFNTYANSVVVKNNATPPKCELWEKVPLDQNNWQTVYDGFGKIEYNQGIQLQPHDIANKSGTHAALATMKTESPAENFLVRVYYHNIKAFRKSSANSWEVFWLFFNYQGQGNEKETNYFIFKPNGVELGKAWGELKQEYLLTHDNPKLEFGQEYELILKRSKSQVDIYINDQLVMNFKDSKDKKLYNHKGTIGLYTEDAQVQITSVELCKN